MKDDVGYTLHVSDRTAAMQLATHFAGQAMQHSRNDDPRARLAEQLSYFDLAFRTIMGSTARAAIKGTGILGGPVPEEATDYASQRARLLAGDRL